MKLVKFQSEQAGQEYTVLKNDQQLFKIATQIRRYKPGEWKDFFPVLGGIGINGKHWAVRSVKISIWRWRENAFRPRFPTEYKSTAHMFRRNTMVNLSG